MRKQIIYLALFAASAISLLSCGSNTSNAQNYVTVQHAPQASQNVNVQSNDIPGFDVNGFANLLKSTTNPDALTQAMNQPGNSINNLDLDNDGQIDYLKVDQVGNNSLGVFDETPNGKVTVATLTVNTQNNSYAINGSPDYCGNNYMYQSQPGLSLGQYMFLAWMLHPHPYYHPYWGYHRGYYGGYRGYRSHYSRPYNSSYMRERRTYTTRTTTTVRNSPTSSVRQTSAPVQQRNSISNPVRSQRSFNSNEGNRFRSSGGNSSGFRSTPSSSTRSSSGSRSSFGGSRSSFGGSRSGGGRRGR